MRIHILGSLSGTEPFVNRHHTSWVLELSNGHLYWFDAGENCSHSGYTKGLDFFQIKSIFISHPHYDHMGGLLNLFSVIHKMHYLEDDKEQRSYELYLPVPELREPFENLTRILGAYPDEATINYNLLTDGGVFENDEIKIEFKGNQHIRVAEGEPHRAFSFRIMAEGKQIVYPADVDKPEEFIEWSKNCDLQFMESGHHHPWDVCQYWREQDCRIGKIIFLHHGRDVLYLPTESKIRSRRAWGSEVFFAEDGMTVEL